MFTLEMFEQEVLSSLWWNKVFLVHTDNSHYKYYIIDKSTWKCMFWRIWANPQYVNYSVSDALKKMWEKFRKWYREVKTKEELDNYYLNSIKFK